MQNINDNRTRPTEFCYDITNIYIQSAKLFNNLGMKYSTLERFKFTSFSRQYGNLKIPYWVYIQGPHKKFQTPVLTISPAPPLKNVYLLRFTFKFYTIKFLNFILKYNYNNF